MVDDARERTVELAGGVRIPLVGLGTWQLRGPTGYQALRYALEHGYRHIDTATMYENEAEVGRAVRDSGVPRTDVFVTTKLPPGREGRERRTLAASLRNLGMEYIDLWLIHWPPARGSAVPIWGELLAAREEGLARAVGVSNFSTAQLDELTAATGTAPALNQIPWGPRRYDPVVLAEAARRAVAVEGYSPFKGLRLNDPMLREVAARYGVTTAQVVIRWHVQHRVIAIPKSATPERITTNADVFEFTLSEDDMTRIDGMRRG